MAMDKKISILCILGILCILVAPLVSSAKWDNIKSYDDTAKTVTIKNSFLYIIPLSTIAEATLDTPQNNLVGAGYQMVAQFTINPKQDYSSILKEFELYDLKDNGKKIVRNVDIKYLTTEQVNVNDYQTDCLNIELKNKTVETKCSQKIIGSHTEDREIWKDFDNNVKLDVPIKIGLFTDVQVNDKVEWIPTIAGVKVSEWASWTANLNVGLVSYYKFDEAVANGGTINDMIGSYNGINNNATNTTGKVGYAYMFDGVNPTTNINISNMNLTSDNFSINCWIYPTNVTNRGSFVSRGSWGESVTEQTFNLEISDNLQNAVQFWVEGGVNWGTTLLSDNNWYMVTGIYNNATGNGTLYLDGIVENYFLQLSSGTSFEVQNTLIGGENRQSASVNFEGKVDECGFWNRTLTDAEVIQLYGISSIVSPPILNSPIDVYNSTSQTITFNGTANATEIANISLIIDAKYNETNSSGINNTDYIFTKTITDGNYNWTYELCDTTNNCANATVRTFTITPLIDFNNYTYNSIITELTSNTFYGHFQTRNALSNSSLQYNGTNYTTSIASLGGNQYILYVTITSPSVPADTNVSWNFWVNNINTMSHNQQVSNINIDNCTVNSIIILNYTLVDENLQTLIVDKNSSIDVDVVLHTITGTEISHYSYIYVNTSYAPVCVNTLSNSTVYIDVITGYVADDYVQEFWFLDNGTLNKNNWLLNPFTIKNVTLRDLVVADSQTFLFKYFNKDFLTQSGAIINVLRQYIGEGIFKEVERCRLDDNGECPLHLIEEDVIYEFQVTIGNTEDYLSGSYNARCLEVPCTITLQQVGTPVIPDTEHDNLPVGTYHLETDKDNRTVTLSFNLNETGEMQLDVFVYSNVVNSPDVLVDSDSIIATIGDVQSFVPLSYGNVTYYAVVRHNGAFVSSTWIDLTETGYHYFGGLGLFLGAILVLTLGLIAVSSGGWTIAFLIFGLLIASITKLIDMDYYLLMFIVSAGGLIVWRLAVRRSL